MKYIASIETKLFDTDHRAGYNGWSPQMSWCSENLQDNMWRYVGEGVFEFVNPQDRLLFLLRWV
jgi:hypothetical protein